MSNIERVNPNAGVLARPEFLRDETVVGIENIKQFVTPPYLKIVQKQGDDSLLDKFGKGAVIMMPMQLPVIKQGESFTFVPIFAWPEYITWSSIDNRSSNIPSIIERSLDPESKLAMKCRDPDAREGTMIYDGKEIEVRHCEHINFLVMLQDHPELSDTLVTLTFTRAEHRTGRHLSGLIKMRKASIFAGRYRATVGEPRTNDFGSWYGMDVENALENPWVSAEEYEAYNELYREAAENHTRGVLRAEVDDDPNSSSDQPVNADNI